MNLVKYNLSLFIPRLLEFIGDEDFPWDEIERKFDKIIDNRVTREKGDTITIETSIFDQIILLKKGDSEYVGLMDVYNKLFLQLQLLLSKDEKRLVLNTVRNLLISYDLKYLNYLGELLVLFKLKQTNDFMLIDVEKILPNGKSIDFDMIITKPNMRVLIEVFSIQINPAKVEDDPSRIRTFINGRIENKFLDKKKNLDADWNVHLIPVIWGGHKEIEIYHRYFKENSMDLPLSYEPLAFLTYHDKDNNYYPTFRSLSTIFNT